jgi:hypothetical protein
MISRILGPSLIDEPSPVSKSAIDCPSKGDRLALPKSTEQQLTPAKMPMMFEI